MPVSQVRNYPLWVSVEGPGAPTDVFLQSPQIFQKHLSSNKGAKRSDKSDASGRSEKSDDDVDTRSRSLLLPCPTLPSPKWCWTTESASPANTGRTKSTSAPPLLAHRSGS